MQESIPAPIGQETTAAPPAGLPAAIVAIVSFASALAFALLGREAGEPGITHIDQRLLQAVIEWTSTWPLSVVVAVTTLGTAPVIIAVTLVAIALCVWRRRWSAVIFLVAAAVGAILLSSWTKQLFARTRPVEFFRVYAPPNSFPSGHALNAASMGLALGFVLWHSSLSQRAKIGWTAVLAIFALCVGASRVVLGVHYATDVLGGYLLALAWVGLLMAVLKIAEHRQWRPGLHHAMRAGPTPSGSADEV